MCAAFAPAGWECVARSAIYAHVDDSGRFTDTLAGETRFPPGRGVSGPIKQETTPLEKMSASAGCSHGQRLRVFAPEQRRPQARQAIVDFLRLMYVHTIRGTVQRPANCPFLLGRDGGH